MSVHALLSRLQRLRKTSAHSWVAACPAHADRSPSLAIRELPNGLVLAHCFAGCAFDAIVAAVGIDVEELFPPKALGHQIARQCRPFQASDALLCLSFEAMFVGMCATDLATGKGLAEADRARLWVSIGHIAAAQDICNG